MKACGIVGSPRKRGNVDVLVSQVLKGASSQGARTLKIYLNDMQIRPCQSCGIDPYPKFCLIHDDMSDIYAALQECDAIVLGSPVYFDTVSAQVKLMIDRCNCLMPYVEHDDGTYGFEGRMKKHKKGVFIAVAGANQEFSTINTTVAGFFSWANITRVDTILFSHDDDQLGGVKSNGETMARAFDIGVRLVGSKKPLQLSRTESTVLQH